MRKRIDSSLPCLAVAVSVLLATEQSSAQATADEVIVTTGFRPAGIADTAGSVTIVDAAQIDARGAEHLEAVLDAAVDVTMSSGASRGRFVQIRGIGDLEQFVDPKHYPSVGVSIDGIDLGGIASAAMLFDVAQVEVLRGPQGTRLGATGLAGQVDIHTIAPSEVFSGFVDAGVADYGTTTLGFAAGGGLGEELAGRVAIRRHRSDGYIDNVYLGRSDTNGYDETTLRGSLRWTPGNATFNVRAIQFDSDNGYDAFSFDNTRETRSDLPGHDDLTLSALGLDGRWELDAGGAVEARLSWLDSDVDYAFDEDWSYVGFCDTTDCPYGGFSNTDRYMRRRDDVTLDLRWLGEPGGSADGGPGFVLGIFAEDRSESLLRQYYGSFLSDYSVDRAALYGQATIPLARRLELTAGYRWERFADRYSDSNAFTAMTDHDLHSGELALRFRLNDRSLFYATLARGNKPGGVNTEASSVTEFVQPRFRSFLDSRLRFASEQLTSLELGFKSELAGGRLGLRAAVFEMAREEAQLESWFWDPVNFLWVGILDNADGNNSGAELELDFAVNDTWRLRAAVGLLATRVDSLTTFDLNLDDFVVRRDIDQARAPAWQAHLGSDWRLGEKWQLTLDVDARDDQRFGYYHDGTIGRATLVNASLTRMLGATELRLWARNLTDEDYAVHGLYFGNDPRNGYSPERYLQLGEPRLAGLSMRRSF